MPEWWPVVFGWPSVVASIAVYAAAFLARRPWLAVVGAALSAPFCLFVSGYPKVGLLGLTALVSNCGAAWALSRRQRRVAGILLLPFLLVAAFVGYAVFCE